jgi:hypothetical protein
MKMQKEILSGNGTSTVKNGKKIKKVSPLVQAENFLNSESIPARVTVVALALVMLAGITTVFAVAPGLSRLAGSYARSKKYTDKQLWSATQNLKKRQYIEEKTDSFGKPRVVLTEKGKKYFEKMLFEESCIPDPKEWDEIWRFVIFDIPVNHSRARDALRFRLRTLGFYQYQKSVWVYPYPCEKEVLFIADYFNVGQFVEIMEVAHLTKDAELRKHFKL